MRRRAQRIAASVVILITVAVVAKPAPASQPSVLDYPVAIVPDDTGGYRIVSTTGAAWDVSGSTLTPQVPYTTTANPTIAVAGLPDNSGYFRIDFTGVVTVWPSSHAVYGDLSNLVLNYPITSMESSATGLGYWLLSADGGIFSFGDVQYYGSPSTLVTPANQTAVDMARSPSGAGYAILTDDGTVYQHGDLFGLGTISLSSVSGATAITANLDPIGTGLWVVDNDGTVHAIDGAPTFGDGTPHANGAFAIDISGAVGGGYRILWEDGTVESFSASGSVGALTPSFEPNASVTVHPGSITVTWVNQPAQPGSPDQWFQVLDYNTFQILANVPTGTGQTSIDIAVPSARFDLDLFVALVNDVGAGPLQHIGRVQPLPCGYWMLGKKGAVYPFGCAGNYGSASVAAANAVDIEATFTGLGYWVLDNSGHVWNFGDALNYGNVDPAVLAPGEHAASIAGTYTGQGYYVFTSRGRAIAFGNALDYGDVTGYSLNGPVLDGIITASGLGYYMLGSDGGVFSLGDAQFYGSMGGQPLNKPAIGMVADGDGAGYWFVASDGGVFSFDADFHGSMGSTPLNKPMTGMVKFGDGYLMVAADGGIFDFSSAPFYGSLGSTPLAIPIVSVTPVGD